MPLIESATAQAGFKPDPEKGQPGAWVNAAGAPVDLMVPERLAGSGGTTAIEPSRSSYRCQSSFSVSQSRAR